MARLQLPHPEESFPLLCRDVVDAPTLTLSSGYPFRLFSVGERGATLAPELIAEVSGGIRALMEPFVNQMESLVCIQPGGTPWGFLLADRLQIPLKVITMQRSDTNGQVPVKVEAGVLNLSRSLYFPRLSAGEAVVVLDVISTGHTLETVVNTLASGGATVLGVVCIVDKSGLAQTLARRLSVPIDCLVDASDLSTHT